MDDFTRKFDAAQDKDEQIHFILTSVYEALKEKGTTPSTRSWAISCLRTPPISPTTTAHGP